MGTPHMTRELSHMSSAVIGPEWKGHDPGLPISLISVPTSSSGWKRESQISPSKPIILDVPLLISFRPDPPCQQLSMTAPLEPLFFHSKPFPLLCLPLNLCKMRKMAAYLLLSKLWRTILLSHTIRSFNLFPQSSGSSFGLSHHVGHL